MTVQQLIQNLSKIQDQQVRVMVSGYEGGYDDASSITPAPIEIALEVNTQWYYGKHEKVEDIDRDKVKHYQIVKAIIL